MYRNFYVILSVIITTIYGTQIPETVPEYIRQCREDDPEIVECLKGALNHLKPYLASGIPEIEFPPIEPFRIEDFNISFSGVRGYKLALNNMDAYGVSNFSVESVVLNYFDMPSEVIFRVPELLINATYKSTGVLIVLPASGQGNFTGVFENLLGHCKFKTSIKNKHHRTYLHIDDLTVKLNNINIAQMVFKPKSKSKTILVQATNHFLKENADLIAQAVVPNIEQNQEKLIKEYANAILDHVPLDLFLIPAKDSIIF